MLSYFSNQKSMAFLPNKETDSSNIDTPVQRRALLKNIRPEQAKSHHALLKAILLKEMAYRSEWDEDLQYEEFQEDCYTYYENLNWCGYLLYLVGDPADTEIMWDAKTVYIDFHCNFGMENLFGAGADASIAYWNTKLANHKIHLNAERLFAMQEFANGYGAFSTQTLDEALADWAEKQRRYFYG